MNAQTFANKLFSLLLIIVTLFSLTSVSSIAKESGEELIPDSPATNNSELAHDNSDNAKKDPLPKHEISKASTDSIQSGVYAISQQNTNTYARCYTVEGGTYMSRQTFSSPPASEAQRHAMFKIIYQVIVQMVYITKDGISLVEIYRHLPHLYQYYSPVTKGVK